MAAPAPREIRIRVPLRWRDLDELGHVNQAVYHELLEEGRAALMGAVISDDESFVLVRVELDYRREVRREAGHVDVVVRVARVGSSSFEVEHDIVLPDGTVAASGRSVLVAWDARERRGRPLNERERRELGG
jgi:acyl-CoA thioester hydrolase